jgi:hypothetical protein
MKPIRSLEVLRHPIRRAILLWCLLAAAVPATAQAPPPAEPQPTRVFCEQSVAYQLADPSTIPESYRRFLGAWTDAAWDANTCAGLIVDDVKSDGTASIIYVYGPLGPNGRVAGGVLHGTGVIRDDELRFQNSDGTQFAFRLAFADLVGNMTTPKGESRQAAFKKTF